MRARCIACCGRGARILVTLALIAWASSGGGSAGVALSDSVKTPPREGILVIEDVGFVGLSRTSPSLASETAGIKRGDRASLESIQEAADRLRSSGLFSDVEVRTRRGRDAGSVIVRFNVSENRPDVRFGVGYEDLSGWYLIPIQVSADNWSGHGEGTDLGWRLGHRVTSLFLSLHRPVRIDSPNRWEVRFEVEAQNRVYFMDGTEIAHGVSRGGVDFRLHRSLSERWGVRAGLALERVEADSSAEVYRAHASEGREQRDPIPFEDLPSTIRDDVGSRGRSRLGAGVFLDTRRGAGLRRSGLWGSCDVDAVMSKGKGYALFRGDLRGYAPLGRGLLLAAQARAATISSSSPFYDRFYLGGLYTVRGYPSHSLSPPQGNINIATASVELRSALIGTARNPRLVGLAFLDLGAGWNGGAPDLDQGAAGIGYGFRLRLPSLGHLGLDVGYPLSRSPLDESFHVNGSLGWTF